MQLFFKQPMAPDTVKDHLNSMCRCEALKGRTQTRNIETPPVGFEPTTRRLTAGCSTAELQGNLASTPAMYSFLTRSNQSLQGMLSVVTFGSADPKTSCCHTLTLTLASLPCGSLFSKVVSSNAYRWLALRGAGSGRASKIFTSSESI